MKAGIGGEPVHCQRDARRIVRSIIGNRSHHDGVDIKHPRQLLEIDIGTHLDPMHFQLLHDDADRHDFKAGDQLQFVVVRHGELILVQRRIVALIEEGKYGHARQLREGIVQLRLVRHLGDAGTA